MTSIDTVFDEFTSVAVEYCAVVDSSRNLDRVEFLFRIYKILPRLIQSGIDLPLISCNDDDPEVSKTNRNRMKVPEWDELYKHLKEKLGDWDLYWQVFDPTADSEALPGSLADDIADIYRDVGYGLAGEKGDLAFQQDAIFSWRLLYHAHWGKHAMSALYAIHFLLNDRLA